MSRSFSWVIGFFSALDRKKTVRDARIRTRRRLESNSTQNDAELRGEQAPVVQRSKSVSKRSIEVEPGSAELLFRTLHAANHLSIYGAVAHWCNRQQVQVTELSTEPQSQLVFRDLISYLP